MNKISSNIIIKFVLLVIAFVFVIIGVINGGYAESLYRSIGICWECIGLG